MNGIEGLDLYLDRKAYPLLFRFRQLDMEQVLNRHAGSRYAGVWEKDGVELHTPAAANRDLPHQSFQNGIEIKKPFFPGRKGMALINIKYVLAWRPFLRQWKGWQRYALTSAKSEILPLLVPREGRCFYAYNLTDKFILAGLIAPSLLAGWRLRL